MIVNIENTMLSKEYVSRDKMFSIVNTFSEWLQKELDQRGWTQSHLSRVAGIARGTLSNISSGNREMGPDTALAIARALNIPPEAVFRAAGLLPPEPKADPILERVNHLLSQLPEDDQENILGLVEALVSRREQEAKGSNRRRRTTTE